MLKVGGEVDSFCSKCDLVLAHTIHAMVGPRPVRVECNTCHNVHAYRPPDRAAAAKKRKPTRSKEKKGSTLTFDEILRGKNPSLAVKYTPKTVFSLDQVMEHPTFGVGYVTEVTEGGMVEVVFRPGATVLVHART
jgi:hypothetical protein